MNKRLNLFILAGLIIALILNSLFVIDEKQDGIVFQFGEAINSDIPTGLNFKLPIIQNVKKYDSRIQTLDEEPNRILTVESKYLIVDSFVKYRIINVRTFYDATSGSFINLNNLLGQRTAFELKKQKIPKLIPIPSTEYPSQINRPNNTSLDCRKIEKIFGIRSLPWIDGLSNVIQNSPA